MIKKLVHHTHFLHKTGMFLAALCFVHCLSMPFLVTLLPLFAEKYFSHTTEIYLVLGSIVIAFFIMGKDYRGHKKRIPILLAAAAGLIQVLGLFVFPHEFETPFVVTGSVMMFVAYLLNFRFHQKYCTNHKH